MKNKLIFLIFFLVSIFSFAQTRISDVQVLATHNSFKKYLDSNLKGILKSICDIRDLPFEDYQHLPLTMQLDFGVRGFELDVFIDEKGRKFSNYNVLSVAGFDGNSKDPSLDKPGFKVMHDPNLDFHSTCHLFSDCLSQIITWSNEHPNHLPIFMHIQIRDQPTPGIGRSASAAKHLNLVIPTLMTNQFLLELENEVTNAVPRGKIITPDQIRANYATLREAVLNNAWPLLSESRGKLIFYMDAEPNIQGMQLENHPSLSGAILFTTPSDENAEDAGFLIVNDPIVFQEKIKTLVEAGFIVRTRSDSGTIDAYANDKTKWQKALSSGGQIISTDYILPAPETGTGYYVFIPDGRPGRCSPSRYATCDANEISE